MDTVDSASKRQATRVFKKSSLNGKITVYLGKRDFVDHITHVDPIGKTTLLLGRAPSPSLCVYLLNLQPKTFPLLFIRTYNVLRYTFLKHFISSQSNYYRSFEISKIRLVRTINPRPISSSSDRLIDSRRSRADRPGLREGSQGFRPRAGRVQVREGGPGRSRADLSKGSLLGGRANLSRGGWRPAEEADAVAREADQEIGEQRVPFLFRVTASLPCVGHAAAGARRHRETVRRRLRIKSVRR